VVVLARSISPVRGERSFRDHLSPLTGLIASRNHNHGLLPCRVDGVLPIRLPPHPSQNRTSGFPSIRLFNILAERRSLSSKDRFPFVLPSLAYGECFSSGFECCEGLHSTSVTWLLRYTGPHPMPSVFCSSSGSRLIAHTRSPSDSASKNGLAGLGSSLVALCCSMPSETPGMETQCRRGHLCFYCLLP